MNKLFIIGLTILVFNGNTSLAQTTVTGGDVSGIWESVNSPYLITDNISIPNDSTLTIEPGVKVEFQGHYSLTVLGRLLAIGTEMDSILFTVKDTTGFSIPDTTLGGWYGIRFIDTPTTNDSSKIVHCCLEFGKAVAPVWHLYAGGAICILQFGKVLISDCLIRNNFAGSTSEEQAIAGGLYFFMSDIMVKNNTFVNNRAYSGGAIYFDQSNPTFINNTIENNFAFFGAGITMDGECYPTFTNDKIINNVAENNGGGLLISATPNVKCENVLVSGNKAQYGAGIGVQGGELQADNCLFSDNRAEIWGGGVACDFGKLNLQDCTFNRDTSDWGSGGLHLDHSIANITNCEFEENKAVFGGGFHAVFSQIICEQNDFHNNTADGAGGIHVEDSDCSIDKCLFQGNEAVNGESGAIDYSVDSTIFGRSYQFDLKRTGIIENVASVRCGAVRIEQTNSDSSLVDVTVDSCQIIRNHSDVYGSLRIGGYFDNFVVSNSIFKSNTSNRYASGPGFISNSKGKVYNCVFNSNYSLYSDSTKSFQGASVQSAEVDFFNCTFIDTSSAEGIGLSIRRGSLANITNCIFWECGNIPINVATAAELGCTVNVNYCDIENGIDSIYVSDSLSVLNWGDGNISEDPLFVDLENADLHLQDASPCIGSGINSFVFNDEILNSPSIDIEGNIRPNPINSSMDMGAFESPLGTPVNTGIFQTSIPDESRLIYNYPNPFTEATTFSYHLSFPCYVDLCIYNIFGQKVATLVSEKQPAGTQNVKWVAGNLSSGQYYYRIKTNTGIINTGKLSLIK